MAEQTMTGSVAGDGYRGAGVHAAWIGLSLLIVVALAWAWLLTRDLFVFTEARGYSLYPFPLSLQRFFLFPELDWGNGRLSGRIAHGLTGAVCGPGAACVNGVTVALTGACLIAVAGHTWQLLRTGATTACVLALWVLSPTMLATWLWQSTRFELLAMLALATTLTFWWWVLGRATLHRGAQAGFVAVTILLLAIGFNAKEITWMLVPTMPLLAIVRGLPHTGAVRRNLRLCAIPVLYGVWFIAWSLTHIIAGPPPVPVVEGLARLLPAGMGIGTDYMYVDQAGPAFDALQAAAVAGFLVFIGATAAVLALAGLRAWAAVRARPAEPDRWSWRRLAGEHGVEVYLVALVVVPTLMGARSATNTSAYYLLLPAWAALVLAVRIGRRVRVLLPHGAGAVRVLSALFVIPGLLAYASLLQPGSTWHQLEAASERLRTTGVELARLLSDRDVRAVWWLTDGVPPTAFCLLRDHRQGRLPTGGHAVGSDLWPFLVGGRPEVTTIIDVSVADLRRTLGGHTGPGDVVVVVDADYRLQLLAHAGQVLVDGAPEQPAAPPA